MGSLASTVFEEQEKTINSIRSEKPEISNYKLKLKIRGRRQRSETKDISYERPKHRYVKSGI